MREFTILAFDDIISGNLWTSHTSTIYYDQLGSADALGLHAVASFVSGTSPSVSCTVEHSANGEDWVPVSGTPQAPVAQIPQTVINANFTSLDGYVDHLNPVLLNYVRVKIVLGGTSPQMRLKLNITGRVSRAVASAGMAANGLAAASR